MGRTYTGFLRGAPPRPLLRFISLVGVAWAVPAVVLSPLPVARTVLVTGFILVWGRQAARPWRPPAGSVPFLALVTLMPLLLAPTAVGDPGGFRPFPFAEGSYADGALAVAAAPVWIHLAVLSGGRDLAWCVPVTLLLAPARHLLTGDFPLWPAWIMWEVGFLLLGSVFRVHGMLYEARLRLDREAVAEERRKIAREVHDLVGHGLGAALLNIGAARLAAFRGDTRATIEALEEAERAGRQSVRDVHRGLVLLRDPARAEGATARALPTAEDIGELVEELRSGGLAVDLTTRGDLGAVDPVTGLAIFRVVQEALSNTARHAPGAAASITVDVGERFVRVTVADQGSTAAGGRSAGGGLGLIGMRERVTALGGTLWAQPEGSGWAVHATIPVGRAAR
ncbi:Histidine kinase-, DNA gyrase B-, and HSP90-like ATPase [Thermomonospora echinospora]|uniref:histidine kinase n=1 Tax=Thermomonospora echinospora TaxID=1992 RepID=A0A1H6DTP3_9ACTN|nr:histidine kinase [Thermomonospora echinospora]SEG88717.1 Histidine kinase-, DNA gyrase B-, and HSP90-like ATPase [Thermomonospora echinospora]